MVMFDVPKVAFLERENGSRTPARIQGISRTGLWVETTGPLDLAFRAHVRVTFPTIEGSIGAMCEVVHVSERGIGLEISGDADDIVRKVIEDWSRGQVSSLHLAAHKKTVAPAGPAVETQPETTDDLQRRKRKTKLAGKEVLIIDDDCGVARLLQAGLARCGGRSHVAQDGLAALDILHAKKVDAVLLDWMLPAMGGAKVLDEIRKIAPYMPVAVVSGIVHSPKMRNEVRKLGADEVFPKPFELSQICEWISSRINGGHA